MHGGRKWARVYLDKKGDNNFTFNQNLLLAKNYHFLGN